MGKRRETWEKDKIKEKLEDITVEYILKKDTKAVTCYNENFDDNLLQDAVEMTDYNN